MICRESDLPLWENVDPLILLISMINISDFLLFKCQSFFAKVGTRSIALGEYRSTDFADILTKIFDF